MILFVDYAIAVECNNEEAWNLCYKCGKCGRKFDDDGIMTDDGGTHERSEDGET